MLDEYSDYQKRPFPGKVQKKTFLKSHFLHLQFLHPKEENINFFKYDVDIKIDYLQNG